MRHTIGTLADLTIALNVAIVELVSPVTPATGTLASATSKLNALLIWYGSSARADGTLASAVSVYNAAVTAYIKPGRDVNIFIGNWTNDGVNVQVPRYSVTVTLQWTDKQGHAQTLTRTLQFPNALQTVPLARLKRYMERIILQEARLQYGVDVEEV